MKKLKINLMMMYLKWKHRELKGRTKQRAIDRDICKYENRIADKYYRSLQKLRVRSKL